MNPVIPQEKFHPALLLILRSSAITYFNYILFKKMGRLFPVSFLFFLQFQLLVLIYIPFLIQVQASQPTEVNMYYQNTYQTMPYGSSYGIPYSYSAYGSSDAKSQKTDNTVPFKTPSNEMTPVTIDLVKKQLKDRQGRSTS